MDSILKHPFIKKIRNIKNARKYLYMSNLEAVRNYFKNSHLKYEFLNFSQAVKKYKTSDTLFIFGSGPSYATLTSEQVAHINSQNSFGISFSFLKPDIFPTFHIFSYETDGEWRFLQETFKNMREHYSQTAICILDKAYYRFIHPRLMPDFFPHNPRCFFYHFPEKSLLFQKDREIRDEDFEQGTLIYRGSMSGVIHIAVDMGYKKIVLVGVDLHTAHHFFDEMPQMKEYIDRIYKLQYSQADKKYPSMETRVNKEITFDTYLEKLADYLKRKRGITIYTSRNSDYMADKLPAYFND